MIIKHTQMGGYFWNAENGCWTAVRSLATDFTFAELPDELPESDIDSCD